MQEIGTETAANRCKARTTRLRREARNPVASMANHVQRCPLALSPALLQEPMYLRVPV